MSYWVIRLLSDALSEVEVLLGYSVTQLLSYSFINDTKQTPFSFQEKGRE